MIEIKELEQDENGFLHSEHGIDKVFIHLLFSDNWIYRHRYSEIIFITLSNRVIVFCIVESQCPSPFTHDDATNFCYYYEQISLSWSEGYNQCLTESINGILIQISSREQFNALKKLHIDSTGPFWLGANNFASCKQS